MNTSTLFKDFASRILDSLDGLPEFTPTQLNAHPLGHANSVAWLLWHTGRELDMQYAHLSGEPEVFTIQGFRERLSLGELGDTMGYGHSAQKAASIQSDDQTALTEYIRACLKRTIEYSKRLTPEQWDEIIDTNWEPPVTRGVRLVSIIDDAVQHVAQAHYVAGMPELKG